MFLSHDWGAEPAHANHQRVAAVNASLQRRGISTWFDNDVLQVNADPRKVHNILRGIAAASVVVVFVTQNYKHKVDDLDTRDACNLEFIFAWSKHGDRRMLPVLMDASMSKTSTWGYCLQAILGQSMYTDLSSVVDGSAEF